MNDFQIKPCKPVLGSKRTGVSEVSGDIVGLVAASCLTEMCGSDVGNESMGMGRSNM